MSRKMYAASQMVNLPDDILVSDAMYKMKSSYYIPQNIKETYYQNQIEESENKFSTSDKLNNLQSRQQNILQKLREIKEKLNNFQESQINHSTNIDKPSSYQKGRSLNDIVIYTDSSRPPFFLLFVKKILAQSLCIFSSSYVHSSSSRVDPAVVKLFQDEHLKERGNCDVALTVIWKNQTAKSLMVKPSSQNEIVGEGNILRFLAREFSFIGYEENVDEVSETDHWIDTIQTKLLHATGKERQSVLKELNSKLGTSDWMNGGKIGICDVFLWSVILQLELSTQLPSNVAKWFSRTNNYAQINLIQSSTA